jgi:hypothetical protein
LTNQVRRLSITEQQHTGGTGEGGVDHSLEVEVLPGGEEGEEVERRRPGEGCDGGEREELERLEDVGDLRHAVGRVDAAAQVHPSLRVRPQRVVEREGQEHAHGRRHGSHLAGAWRARCSMAGQGLARPHGTRVTHSRESTGYHYIRSYVDAKWTEFSSGLWLSAQHFTYKNGNGKGWS